MDFVRLRTLRELALRNTMAAVADALHITPSAVSQQIAQLEDELQVKLVERRGRGVLLTPAGKRLVAHVEKLTAVLEEAKTDVAEMKSVVAGELRVAAFPSVASMMIPRAIHALERQNPHLTVIFDELEPIDGVAALRSWQVDIALIDDLTLEGVLPDAGIETHGLGTDELLVMLPKSHRFANRKSLPLGELRDEALGSRHARDLLGNHHSRLRAGWLSSQGQRQLQRFPGDRGHGDRRLLGLGDARTARSQQPRRLPCRPSRPADQANHLDRASPRSAT